MAGTKRLSASPGSSALPSRNAIFSSRIMASPVVTDVMRDHVGQPKQIIADPGANARSRIGMPPMLDISFDKLPGSGGQNLGARDPGRGVNQCHHILQLIAKPEGAARLIEGSATPDAATQRLVKEPAIEQEVGRKLGRFDFNRSEQTIPPLAGSLECSLGLCRITESFYERLRLFFILRLAKDEGKFSRLAGIDLDGDLQRGARIESDPGFTR